LCNLIFITVAGPYLSLTDFRFVVDGTGVNTSHDHHVKCNLCPNHDNFSSSYMTDHLVVIAWWPTLIPWKCQQVALKFYIILSCGMC